MDTQTDTNMLMWVWNLCTINEGLWTVYKGLQVVPPKS